MAFASKEGHNTLYAVSAVIENATAGSPAMNQKSVDIADAKIMVTRTVASDAWNRAAAAGAQEVHNLH
jgi:hypothetical protein